MPGDRAYIERTSVSREPGNPGLRCCSSGGRISIGNARSRQPREKQGGRTAAKNSHQKMPAPRSLRRVTTRDANPRSRRTRVISHSGSDHLGPGPRSGVGPARVPVCRARSPWEGATLAGSPVPRRSRTGLRTAAPAPAKGKSVARCSACRADRVCRCSSECSRSA